MKPKILPSDRVLAFLAWALVLFGVVMVFDSSYAHGLAYYKDGWFFARKQIVFAAAGLVAMRFVSRFDYGRLRGWAPHLYVVSVMLLVLVALMGSAALGGQRWLGVAGFNLQPSEIAKPALIVAVAEALRRWPTITRDKGPFALFCVAVAVPIVLTERQPDLGTAVTMALGVAGILVVAGTRGRFLVAAGVASIALVAALMLLPGRGSAKPGDEGKGHFRLRRIAVMANPGDARYGDGLQNWHSYVAMANGGLTGVGYTNSMEKRVGGVPMQRTDFIFAIIGEEFGLVGTVVVLTGFLMIAVRGFGIACRCRDPFGQYLAVGITTGIVGQGALNMAVVTGLLPVTGVPLPLVSYGGSALVTTLLSIGVLLGISRVPFRRAVSDDSAGDAFDGPGGAKAMGRGAGR